MSYAVPPHSNLSVAADYGTLDVEGASLAVVLDASSIVVDDAEAVLAHVGEGVDAPTVLRSLIEVRFPAALKEEAPFGEVFVVDPADLPPSALAPTSGTTFEVVGRTPDFVLYIDSLHQYRAKYPSGGIAGLGGAPGMPGMGGGFTQAVRDDVDYRLWDNRAGRLAASGRVESEENITLIPGRGAYVGAVEEMAEKLTQELRVRTR